MVFSIAFVKRCLKKVFQPTQKVLELWLVHRLFSTSLDFYNVLYTNFTLILHIFLLILFSTSQYSRLDRFIVYLVYLLSMWYTHSHTFLPFRLGTTVVASAAPTPTKRGGNPRFVLDIGGYFILDIHWLIWFDVFTCFV